MGDENVHVAIVIVLLIILICVGMQRYRQVEADTRARDPEAFGGGGRGGGRGGFGGGRGGFRGAHRGGVTINAPHYYGGYGRRFRPGYVGPAYYDSPWYYSWLPWNDTVIPNYENSVVSAKQIEIRPDGLSVSVDLDSNGNWRRFVGGSLDSEGQIASARANSILKLAEVEPEDNTDSTLTVIIVYASGNSTAKTVARSVIPDDLRV